LRDINVSYFAKEELEEIAKKLTNKYRIDESIIEGDLFLILQK
jgi:metallophosphoesterase superfamily enzyme